MKDEEFEKELQEELRASGIVTPEVDPEIVRNEQYAPPPQPQPQEPETYPNVRRLCIISLICYAIPYVFASAGSTLISEMLRSTINSAKDFSMISSGIMVAGEGLMAGSYIAAWVLMIIARVKNKKDVFAKVLMIIYIVGAVLTIIAIILLIALFAALAHVVAESCGSLQ